jgi:hypothetical protein
MKSAVSFRFSPPYSVLPVPVVPPSDSDSDSVVLEMEGGLVVLLAAVVVAVVVVVVLVPVLPACPNYYRFWLVLSLLCAAAWCRLPIRGCNSA